MEIISKSYLSVSHAACYAIVSYQTAFLKYYYPVEFMAALMTSVIDNSGKVSEYIHVCRQMGISILPPDVNSGERTFSVQGKNIRYALSAIKNVGGAVIDGIVEERTKRGTFRDLKDFITRNAGRDVSKRVIENFIKAGALDSIPGTRRQKMMVYSRIQDEAVKEAKTTMEGQMSLFDFMPDSERKKFEIRLPDVGEYDKEQMLSFEKEVLGIYVSGHPLDSDRKKWEMHVTAKTTDFIPDEETGEFPLRDQQKVVIGGMITSVNIKYTKKNQVIAFLTVEDLVGSVEVIVFSKAFEKYQKILTEEAKVFIEGIADVGDDRAGKLKCSSVTLFSEIPSELWIQFPDKETYHQREDELLSCLRNSDGKDLVVIYIRNPRAIKRMSRNWSVCADETLIELLSTKFGKENVRIVEK